MEAVNLRIEYLTDPIGIDIINPRFFWNCRNGVSQSAYQIMAVNENGSIMWDSGRIESQEMTHVTYEGKALQSRDRIEWRVKLWDEENVEGEWSEAAFFELGLLHQNDWKASWITGNYRPDKAVRYPVDYFRKVFTVKKSQIKKARIYCTACGVYQAKFNEAEISEDVLTPGHTDYRKRIQYQTYDITSLIKDGKNQIMFMLADGWYRGSVGAWGIRNFYGNQTMLLAQIELTCLDGSIHYVNTDESFDWSNDGEIRFADNKDGELIDSRKNPTYSHKAQKTHNKVIPSASNNVPIRERERFKAEVIVTPSGKRVLDFGQNIAGYIEFEIAAKEGQKIKLRFGEMLDAQGEFTQANIQCSNKKKTTPLQQIKYICKNGDNHYKTKFAIFGFQYVLVEADMDVRADQFTAIAVYSAMDTMADFESSNKLLNQFVHSTLWSARNNSADVPTDCPTRERHGWTGDAQIFFTTAGYLLDYAAFARKYMRDLTDWQRKDGAFPQIAPEGGTDFYMKSMNGSVGWADAGVMIPYRFWKLYGDRQILADNYEAMWQYAQFMIRRCGKKGITAKKLKISRSARKFIVNTGQSYGEWAEPKDVHITTWKDCAIPHPEVSTAYTSYVMRLMKEIALELGKETDSRQFSYYEEQTRTAYQELVNTAEHTLQTEQQARLVRPLYFNLLNSTQTEYAQKQLIQVLENYRWRIGTGFLSTPLILDVLERIDLDAAYRLLENEEMPGWLFMPKSGANTIWESWEGTQAHDGIASLNHYSKGASCEWIFRRMCGVEVQGKRHFRIEPTPGGHFTFARLSYRSIYGEVKSEWERKDGKTLFRIEIPANTTAQYRLPDGKNGLLEAGIHIFETVSD